MSETRILVIEDSEGKYRNVEAALREVVGTTAILVRAGTAVEAERLVLDGSWNLVVLDVSIDIVERGPGGGSGGHATLGGMAVAEKMYLLSREYPTVIVTAFDAFQAQAPTNPTNSVVGLEYIDAYAAQLLGAAYLGSVRYSDSGWKSLLQKIVRERFER